MSVLDYLTKYSTESLSAAMAQIIIQASKDETLVFRLYSDKDDLIGEGKPVLETNLDNGEELVFSHTFTNLPSRTVPKYVAVNIDTQEIVVLLLTQHKTYKKKDELIIRWKVSAPLNPSSRMKAPPAANIPFVKKIPDRWEGGFNPSRREENKWEID